MTRSAFTVRLIAAATLLLASACGTTTTTPTATPTTTTSGAAASGGVLGVAKTSLGSVLVDSRGMTVYLLTADAPGQSTCSALCLDKWPLVPAPAGNVSVPGVGAPLGVTKATSGASMLTVGGLPLYTYSGDSAAGDTHGEGIESYGGKWYAVSPSGVAVKGSVGSAPSSDPAPAPAVPGY